MVDQITASVNEETKIRDILVIQLLELSKGNNYVKQSLDIVDRFIGVIAKLVNNLELEDTKETFLQELILLVKDERIPLKMESKWLVKLLYFHENIIKVHGISNNRKIGISFYRRIYLVLKFTESKTLKYWDDDIHSFFKFVELVLPIGYPATGDKDVIFLRKYFAENTWYNMGIPIQKIWLPYAKLKLFKRLFDKISTERDLYEINKILDILGRKKFNAHSQPFQKYIEFFRSDVVSIIEDLYNGDEPDYHIWFFFWTNKESLDDFIYLGIPAILRKLNKASFKHIHDPEILKVWLTIWNTHYQTMKPVKLVKRIGYLPKVVAGNPKSKPGLIDHLIQGENIKDFDPNNLYFTKKMSHFFMKNDKGYDIDHMQRNSFYNTILYEEDILNYMGNIFDNNGAFSKETCSLIHQFAHKIKQWDLKNQPDEERLIGFLDHAYREIDGFNLKYVTLKSLRRRAETYYHEIDQENENVEYFEWDKSSVDNFSYRLGDFEILQLKNSNALRKEGATLSHCVGGYGYAENCVEGSISIWSLRNREGKPLLTIELEKNIIVQISGKYNRSPLPFEMDVIHEWIKLNKFKIEENSF